MSKNAWQPNNLYAGLMIPVLFGADLATIPIWLSNVSAHTNATLYKNTLFFKETRWNNLSMMLIKEKGCDHTY